jgi:hypothetical protein
MAVCVMAGGCAVGEFFVPRGGPSNEQIYAVYRQTQLKVSTSADVLAAFGHPDNELLSQSKSIIATAGEKSKGYKRWFNMVAFDEDALKAIRKYVFISDERPKQLFVEPWEGVYFDCKIVLPKEVLDEPYANESARRIAILKEVEKDLRKDTKEIGADNKEVETCGLAAAQGIDTLLVILNESPVQAERLSGPEGIEFEEASYGKGRLKMTIENDVVSVELRLGSFAKKLKVSLVREVKGE